MTSDSQCSQRVGGLHCAAHISHHLCLSPSPSAFDWPCALPSTLFAQPLDQHAHTSLVVFLVTVHNVRFAVLLLRERTPPCCTHQSPSVPQPLSFCPSIGHVHGHPHFIPPLDQHAHTLAVFLVKVHDVRLAMLWSRKRAPSPYTHHSPSVPQPPLLLAPESAMCIVINTPCTPLDQHPRPPGQL